MQEKEIWKSVVGFEGIYEVSNLGSVKSIYNNGRILKGYNCNGYRAVSMWKNKKGTIKYIHHIVLESFLHERIDGFIVNHKDGIKFNNRLDNLEYSTYSDNNQHAYNIGLKTGVNRKFSREQILEIISLHPRYSFKSIADMYGVGFGTITQIFYGQTYRKFTGIQKKYGKKK